MNKATKMIATFALGLSVFAGATAIGPKTTNAATVTASTNTATIANKIIATGERYMGTPYRFGSASGTTKTFDCSSFVQYVYGKNGIKLPRSSHGHVGKFVPRNQLKPGVFLFADSSRSNLHWQR
jgi:murein DD-endopeptidase / murein LD-carboxypeptidase